MPEPGSIEDFALAFGTVAVALLVGMLMLWFFFLPMRRERRKKQYKCPRCGSLTIPPDIWIPEKASTLMAPDGTNTLNLGLAVEDMDYLNRGHRLTYLYPSPGFGVPARVNLVKERSGAAKPNDQEDDFTFVIPAEDLLRFMTLEGVVLTADTQYPGTKVELIDLTEWEEKA